MPCETPIYNHEGSSFHKENMTGISHVSTFQHKVSAWENNLAHPYMESALEIFGTHSHHGHDTYHDHHDNHHPLCSDEAQDNDQVLEFLGVFYETSPLLWTGLQGRTD